MWAGVAAGSRPHPPGLAEFLPPLPTTLLAMLAPGCPSLFSLNITLLLPEPSAASFLQERLCVVGGGLGGSSQSSQIIMSRGAGEFARKPDVVWLLSLPLRGTAPPSPP